MNTLARTIEVLPAFSAASMRVSVTVLRQSTQVPKMSKNRALGSGFNAMLSAVKRKE